MDLQLNDRVFVVTGGARGLGRATAECLVADGARVVLTDVPRVADVQHQLYELIQSAGQEA